MKRVDPNIKLGAVLTNDVTPQLNYYHAVKRMPAQPTTGYRVAAEVRTEGLARSKGAQIQVGDGREWLATRSANLSEEVKSPVWQTVTVDYITLPDASEIEIRVRRLEGSGDKGRIFVRNVQVFRFTPFNLGAVPYLSVAASKTRQRICLAIINKHLEQLVETRVVGLKARRAEAWCLTGPSMDATNERDPKTVRPRSLPVEIVKGQLRFTLPPHSLTFVVAE